jgi:hypothetical protein
LEDLFLLSRQPRAMDVLFCAKRRRGGEDSFAAAKFFFDERTEGMPETEKGKKGSRGAADVTRIGKADCAFRRDAGRTILGAMSEASVMVFSGGGPACEWRSRDAIGVSR